MCPKDTFLIRWQTGVFILREKGNSSGRAKDRGDMFMDGTKATAGQRVWVQRTGTGSPHPLKVGGRE